MLPFSVHLPSLGNFDSLKSWNYCRDGNFSIPVFCTDAMKRVLLFCLLLLPSWSCGSGMKSYVPEPPDYDDASSWYVSLVENRKAAVFYVTPTCVFDWKRPDGQLCHHYDVRGEVQKKNFDWSLSLADEIFGRECDFYAPYYRQVTLDSWMDGEEVAEERFSLAMEDVQAAFRHFLTEDCPEGDFVLAGFSQGAKAVLELVEAMEAPILERMIAAYVIGYKVTEEDLSSPNVRPAQGEMDHGVVIAYNSVRTLEDSWPAVSEGNEVCINPVNWKTDTTAAWLPYKGGQVRVRVHPAAKVLEVSGYDGGGFSIKAMEGNIPSGNYHLSELTLYKACLQENMKKRMDRK